MPTSLEEQRKQTRIQIEEKIAGTSSTNSLIVREAIKMIQEERKRNEELVATLESCGFRAKNIIERGYSETMDAHDIVEMVKGQTKREQ